jgi:hypothetical protein
MNGTYDCVTIPGVLKLISISMAMTRQAGPHQAAEDVPAM